MSKDITRGMIRQKKTHQRCTKRSDTAEKVCAKHRKQGDCAPLWKARRLYTLLENRGTVHPSGKQGDCARVWKSRGTVHAFGKQGLCAFWKAEVQGEKSSPTPFSLIYRHRPRAPVQPPPSPAGIPLNMSVEIC